jgi:hypothetical protein
MSRSNHGPAVPPREDALFADLSAVRFHFFELRHLFLPDRQRSGHLQSGVRPDRAGLPLFLIALPHLCDAT